MANEKEEHWVISDAPCSVVVVNPLSVHYQNAARHVEMICRERPPLDQDLFGAPDECAMVVENLFGAIYRNRGIGGGNGWPLETLTQFGIRVGGTAGDLLAKLRHFWNRDKHGKKLDDPIEAYKTATPEFAVDVFNLTGALLGAYFLRADGSRADWIRMAIAVGSGFELHLASESDQEQLRESWEVKTQDP